MRLRAGLLFFAVSCAVLVVACGGGTEQGTSATTPPEASIPGETAPTPSDSDISGTPSDSDISGTPSDSDIKENEQPWIANAIDVQNVAVGETLVVNVTRTFVDPDGDPLSYGAYSSNEAVAIASVAGSTVNVTGVGEGAATVEVTARDSHGQSVLQTFEVFVEIAVTSLEVSGSALGAIGEVAELGVVAGLADGSSRVLDGSLVRWRSSDVRVVTVAEGAVTAVGGGTATVTATYEGLSAQMSLSVPGMVRVLYAVPSDREFRSDYSEAIESAVLGVQSWYHEQLNGLTFSLADTVPEHCAMAQPSDFYGRYSWDRVVDSVQHCAPVSQGTSYFTWIIYADVMDECGPFELGFDRLGRGGNGLTILAREDLAGLVDEDAGHRACWNGELQHPVDAAYGRWEGGLAHELGHAFHLIHPPGCDEYLPHCDEPALMAGGSNEYPDAYLRFDEKETLLRSLFIEGAKPSAGRESAGRGAAVRGTVMDPGGVPVEGVRLSLGVEPYWSWTQTGADGAFEITLPRTASGSAALSVHAGQAADCRWLGYHYPGGLTTRRSSATAVPVRADEVTEITLELPARPEELCAGPRAFRLAVRETDGTPARRLALRAFGRYAYTEPSGTAEIPLNQAMTIRSILSIYDEALDCGLLGYYGADNTFTTRREDAAHFDIGAGVTELTLPADRRDLCDAQELITGTVQWPNGKAATGIWLDAEAVATGSRVGADGTFEIRQPPGSPPTVISAYSNGVSNCGWVGYLGPDGLVTQRAEAVPAKGGTSLTITLPAEPDELCTTQTGT